ncbi:hypothetical protein ACFO0N_04430 [Halobium salinum]|uniref:DUF7993 domain-containing protein n=1 Tax=Halobium salinum TaxID=1364940 RepID=A0ABD5P8W1_9EURY|nr:hypothetical protein [Halobium salinum]
MVQDRLRDGKRIAQLLASEVEGDRGVLGSLSVVDADPDVEPTTDGAFAFALSRRDETDAEPERVAEVYVQPDRARVEFLVQPDVAAAAATDADLRVRPKAVRPPRTLVFLEDGADAKRVLPVFEAVVEG